MVITCDKCSFDANHRHQLEEQKLSCQCELKPWKCKFQKCEFRTRHKIVLKRHTLAKHTPGRKRNVQCPLCPSSFYTKSKLQLHILSHIKEKCHRCSYCKFETHGKRMLTTHIRHVHKISSVTLECTFADCNFQTTTKATLRKHLQTHDPDRPVIRCTFPSCTHHAFTVGNLRRHVNMRHNPDRKKLFCCPLCSKLFSYKETLTVHIEAAHTNESYYRCDECPFATYRRSSLRQHSMKVHGHGRQGKAPEKTVKCESCEFRARYAYQLGFHMSKVHASTRRLPCNHPGCNFKTNYPRTLQQHMYLHEEDPERQFPFACTFPDCGFRSKKISMVTLHERRHETSGKFQLQCKLCPNKFYPDRASLLFHMRLIHSKTFGCKMCDFGAFSRKTLSVHIRKHHNYYSRSHYGTAAIAGTVGAGENLKKEQLTCHKNLPSNVSCSFQAAVVILERIHLETK